MNASRQKENKHTLDLLDAIEQQDDVSQRHLAQHMDVALGLANTYLKRCVKKGWVKITTAPANRYLYYLTPKGFTEKARLTGEFLTTSLTLVRQSGDAYIELYQQCLANGCDSVIFVGLSDLTEMAYLRLLNEPLQALGVYHPPILTEDLNYIELSDGEEEWFGMPILQVISSLQAENTAFVFTALACGKELNDLIQQSLPQAKVYTPQFLSTQSLAAETNVDEKNENKLKKVNEA